jgi:hypothetical protein
MDAFRNGWVQSALVLSVLLPLYLLAAALGTKMAYSTGGQASPS